MTRAIFSKWLKGFDDDMDCQKRNVCLLMDSCIAYHDSEVQLKDTQLGYFSPHVASVIHPLDQGIINTVRCTYKHRMIEKMQLNLGLIRDTNIDVFIALDMVATSWKAATRSIIINTFEACQLQSTHCRGSVGL